MRLPRWLLAPAPVVALLVSLAVVDAGWFVVIPGTSENVFPRIQVDGVETHPHDGKLLLTTVTIPRASPGMMIRAGLDSAIEVMTEEELYGGLTEQQYERVTLSQMDESKIAAVAVAARRLTDYPQEHDPGALVQDVVPGTPAAGSLFAGDLIVTADDEPVEDVDELGELIRATEGRRALTLTVEAGGEERTVRVRPEHDPELDRPVLGVILIDPFPFEVVIESGAIGGPSAGLMWALGMYEVLSEEDLLLGRVVAGTGTIDLDGNVGPVGGVGQKVRAAQDAGAEIFLVPRQQHREAEAIGADLRLVPVGTVGQAVSFLRSTRP